ncbi:MAG: sensor histidine kinase [Angustibacter sp.]
MRRALRPEARASGRRRAGRAGGAAIVVAALAVLAAGAGLAVTTAGGAWGLSAAPQLVVDAVVGLSCPVVAAVMLAAGRLSVGARRLAVVLLVAGTASALTALTTALGLTAASATTSARWWSQLQSFLWVPGFLPLVTLVPLLYPDGLPSRRPLWRAAAGASALGVVLLTVGVALYDEPLRGRVVVPKLVTQTAAAQSLAITGAALLIPGLLLALAAVVVRYRGSQGLARRQIAVLVAAVLVLVVVTAVQGLLPSPVDVLLQAVSVALVPVAIGVAVTRHRLYDLDLAVRRALVVASLLVCLVGAYLTLVALADATLTAIGLGGSTLSVAVAAGVTGAVLQPLGRQLTAGIDRLYFGHRSDPYRVTSRLGTQLAAAAGDVAEVPRIVCATVVEQLRLRGARVLVGEGSDVPAASAGEAADVLTLELDLRHRGQVVGQLQVASRDGQEQLEERDVEVLQAVADLAAPAMAALALQRDLQRSRESIVAAREAERHRLRNDLHDGLGASLAGVRLQIETAQDLVEGSPAVALLDAAGAGVATALAEVRTIVDGLRPPGIDDLGLVGALTSLVARFDGSGVRVELCVDGELALDPAIEVAVYRIAAEALTNVVRHASASRATLHAHADRAVELLVSDDGRGLVLDGVGAGVGLSSMRQRAEEVGGRLDVRPGADGGTDVRAVLPVVVGGPT